MICPGCQGVFPNPAPNPASGPTHGYMLSSPACWAVYGQILASEFSDPARMRLHRLSVDAYAVQHPGVDVPSARRSVAVHLSRLYLFLEHAWPIDRINAVMPHIGALKDSREWLDPPSFAATLTVLDAVNAPTTAEHERRILAWAASVWKAWSPHHPTVRSWCAPLVPRS